MFSTGSLILQLGYLLLVAAAAMSPRVPRLLLALSATVALGHAITFSHSRVTMIWMALLLGCCLVMFARDLLATRGARFSDEEAPMISGFLAGVPHQVARHLIDRGMWLRGTVGDELTREGERVERIVYLASGEALVMSDGRQVATCRAGDLVGEASILTGESATATVVLAGPARFWCLPAETLRACMDADPQLRPLLERGFARAVRNKLHASNRTIAAAGGVA